MKIKNKNVLKYHLIPKTSHTLKSIFKKLTLGIAIVLIEMFEFIRGYY